MTRLTTLASKGLADMYTNKSAAISEMICVNTLSGTQLHVQLAQQATIKDLKGAIKTLIGVDRRNQQIIVDGCVTKARDVLGTHKRIELVICSPMCICGNDAVKLCSRCNDKSYCSRQCQNRDWANHKGGCNGLSRGSNTSGA